MKLMTIKAIYLNISLPFLANRSRIVFRALNPEIDMAFIRERLNKDNFWNLVFWAAVTLDVYTFLPSSYLMTFLIFIGLVFALKELSPLTLVAKRGDVITKLITIEDLNKEVAKEASSLNIEENKELPEIEIALANSEGRIVSKDNPNFMLTAWSPIALGVPLYMILWKGMGIDIGFELFTLMPVSIFIIYNRPITLLFNSMAWYLQGWRQIRPTLYQRTYDPRFSSYYCNIYHKR